MTSLSHSPIVSMSQVISKYYEESIQTSLLSSQIDKYENVNKYFINYAIAKLLPFQ